MEAYHLESVGTAKVEQDDSTSLLIHIEEAAQEAAVEPSSYNTSTEPTLAQAFAEEKQFLLEISANKERIAHVAEISEANQDIRYFLRIQSITYPSTGPVEFSKGVMEKDITDCMQCRDKSTFSFLSLSPIGDRVAISFCKFESDDKLISQGPTTKCCVFHVDESGMIKMEKQIQCQGKAIFTSDDHLAIVSDSILNLYNCKRDYEFASCLDIRPLFPPPPPPPTRLTPPEQYIHTAAHQVFWIPTEHYIYTAAQQVFWSPSFNGPLDFYASSYKTRSRLQMLLHLTRFINYNLLTPCFQMHACSKRVYDYDGPCVWSLVDGARSLPFQIRDTEEIHAVSYDKTLLAVFGETSPHLSVYDIKSGRLVSRLTSAKNIRLPDPYAVGEDSLHCVHFSKDNMHIILISILDGIEAENLDEALFVVEVWSIDTEELLLEHEEKISFKWRSRNNLMPYIVESADSPPTFTAVYKTMSETGMFEVRSLHLRLPSTKDTARAAEKWKIERRIAGKHLRFYERGTVLLLNAYDGVRYQLCFGKSTVELWRLYQKNNQGKQDLIYIRAFHAPYYNQREAFQEKWGLKHYENIHTCEDVDLLPLFGVTFTGDTAFIETVSDRAVFDRSSMCFKEIGLHLDQIHLPFHDLEIAEAGCVLEKPFEFVCSGFHYVESVCRGLYHLHREGDRKTELFKQIKRLAEKSIKKMKNEKSRYFTTISGSNTLAMLATFQDGRDIIFQILQTDDLLIGLFTYVRRRAMTDKHNEYEARKENAMTILIEKFDYELFSLMFNRVLLHATVLGVGALCVVGDTLMFLQERSETAILQSSCQKLKFLKVETNPSNPRIAMDLELSHNSMNAEFSDFPSYVMWEQLPRHDSITRHDSIARLRFLHWLQQIKQAIVKTLMNRRLYRYYRSSMSKPMAHANLLSVCAVPFVYFSSYAIFWEDLEFYTNHSNREDRSYTARIVTTFHKLLSLPNRTQDKIVHKAESDLMKLASKQHENDIFHQKGSIIEVLLYYKWKTFIRHRFYLVCFIHLVYYFAFIFGVLFARECFAYTLGTSILNSPGHVVLIALMFTMNLILSVQELLQFIKLGFWKYFKSIYNIIDLAALIMSPVCFCLMITASSNLDEVCAITTIVLWIHGILRLRPFAFIGVTLETMIQLMKSVYKTLFIMLLVIFAFTHAFIVLLLHKDDSYFQNQYSGSIGLTDSESTVSYSDVSASNSFTNVFKAFSTLWLFIYGVWDPITDGDAGDDFMIIVFAMLFSFVTVLLFFNLVIALMSSKAEEVKALGKSIWLSHFAEVIAEIEQFWCFRSERIDRNNSPSVVYYIAKYTDVRQQAEVLEQECDELIKKLRIKLQKRQRAGRSTCDDDGNTKDEII